MGHACGYDTRLTSINRNVTSRMALYQTQTLHPDAEGIDRAAAWLADGHLVALPTETVYGLAGDATSDLACARIFEAKGRPRFNPLIVHLPSREAARGIAEFPGDAEALAVLDAGPCTVGVESTILAPGPEGTRLLREGGLPREAVEPLTGPLVPDTTPGTVQAPGQLGSHYAPAAALELNSDLSDPRAIRVDFAAAQADLTLSRTGDLVEAAASLFRTLHEADALATARNLPIHIAPIPDRGLGRAINDRLRRAAAPRS